MVKPGDFAKSDSGMGQGDGSPCEQMWEWIESHRFDTKEDALAYLDTNGGNEHAYECVENYPWPDEQGRDLTYHVYLNRYPDGSLVEYYSVHRDADGKNTSKKDIDTVTETVEHIRDIPAERELRAHAYLIVERRRDRLGRFKPGYNVFTDKILYTDLATGKRTTPGIGDIVTETIEHVL